VRVEESNGSTYRVELNRSGSLGEGEGMGRARLDGRRVLILGASAGIGKAASLAVAAEGGRVALAARRRQLLDEAVADAGPGCFAFECDVRDPAACERVVRESVDALGGLDAVVYAPGLTLFGEIEEMGGAEWRETFETNVFGASLITRAALPHLLSTRGKVIYFSSFSINDRPPRAGMSVYVASKVALESMTQAWQGEHPGIGFTTIAIGDTLTEKAVTTPPEVVTKWLPRWAAVGLGSDRLMDPASVADQVVNILSSRERVRQVAITPIPSD
jgi:NAD(P)-dependent dehydrogenase (short-subunit alcohol dehydrogenase family)